MQVREQGDDSITLCNKCKQPASDPVVGIDGERYHRHCGQSLAMLN